MPWRISKAWSLGRKLWASPSHRRERPSAQFCDASLDYNPLHLDDNYMKGSFGKTSFGGIIMHGMTNFGLLTGMLTDWGTRMTPFTGGWRPAGAYR